MKEINIGEIIVDEEVTISELQLDVEKVYPELENLIIVPLEKQQVFKSEKCYGYDKITVEAIDSEELNVTSNLNFSSEDKIQIIPENGRYIKKIIINKDANLLPQNIKSNIKIFGVTGTGEILDTSDATATVEDISLGKTAYVKGKKITGALKAEGYNISIDPTKKNNKTFDLLKLITQIKPDSLGDTSEYNTFASAFKGLQNLLVIPEINTSNATSLNFMFEGCMKIKYIPDINTDKVTSMAYTFDGCESLLEIPNLNTGKVTNMDYLFHSCKQLKEVKNINMQNVTICSHMFDGCNSLETIETINVSKVQNIIYMLSGCHNLKTNLNLDLANCVYASYAFSGCGKNTNNQITLSNTSKVTDWNYAFANFCSKNVSIDDMSGATKVEDMFAQWQGETLPINSIGKATSLYCFCLNATGLVTFPQIDTSKVIRFQRFLDGCSNLVNMPALDMTNAYNNSYIQNMFHDCLSLSDDSLNNILASLATAVKVTSTTIKKLSYVGLSKEQAEKCITLSNWQTLSENGWVTGY